MRRESGSVLALAAAAMLAGAPAADAAPHRPPPTIAGLRAAIAREGAQRVVTRLWTDGAWADVVEPRIDAAVPGWIELAPLLAPGTDAATSEGLTLSLASALPHAPDRVLAVLDMHGLSPVLRPDSVCSAGFIEVPAAEIAAYRARALDALRHVRARALIAARDACIASLTGVR